MPELPVQKRPGLGRQRKREPHWLASVLHSALEAPRPREDQACYSGLASEGRVPKQEAEVQGGLGANFEERALIKAA